MLDEYTLEITTDYDLQKHFQESMEAAWEQFRKKGYDGIEYEMAFKRGFKEGYEEGYKQGVKEVKLAHAQKMKALQYPVESIIEITGLPREVIETLK